MPRGDIHDGRTDRFARSRAVRYALGNARPCLESAREPDPRRNPPDPRLGDPSVVRVR